MTLLQGALRLAFDLNVPSLPPIRPPFRRTTTTSSSAVSCRAPRPFNLRTIITRPPPPSFCSIVSYSTSNNYRSKRAGIIRNKNTNERDLSLTRFWVYIEDRGKGDNSLSFFLSLFLFLYNKWIEKIKITSVESVEIGDPWSRARECNVVRKVKVFSVIEHRGLDRKRITRTRVYEAVYNARVLVKAVSLCLAAFSFHSKYFPPNTVSSLRFRRTKSFLRTDKIDH